MSSLQCGTPGNATGLLVALVGAPTKPPVCNSGPRRTFLLSSFWGVYLRITSLALLNAPRLSAPAFADLEGSNRGKYGLAAYVYVC